MQKKLVGFSLLAAACMAPAVHAQGLGNKIEVGVFGQYTKLDSALVMDNVFGVGGRLGISVYKWLGVEGDIQTGKTKSNKAPFEDITYRPFRGLITLTVPMSTHTGLVLGGGYLNSVFDGRSTANEYEDGISGLVGLKLCGNGKWGARLDGIADYNPSPNEQALTGTSTNFGARVGITYALKGACGGEGEKFDWGLAMAPAAATVARGANRQFAISASDMKSRPIELRKVNDLSCMSSDATVATVDNTGNVTAVKTGSATITCRGMVKNLNRSASSTVTVPAPEWTFTLTPPTQTKDVGQTATYTTTARDADGVDLGLASTWSSSNAGVATISNGVATCVSAGSATITATKSAYGATKSATAALVCNALPTAMVRLDSTHFNFDQARVLPAGEVLLQTVIDAMKRDPSIRISVEGHTDWYGDEAYNEKLAASRAEAVTKILRRLGGSDIAADRISSMSYGERCILVRDGDPDPGPPRPFVSAANKAKQAPNRRVEIWQLLPGRSGSPATCRTEAERVGRVPFDAMH